MAVDGVAEDADDAARAVMAGNLAAVATAGVTRALLC
jgi:hypothetical protein